MTKQETIQVITLLAGNYDSISQKSAEQKQLMVNTWYECLNDLDYRVVLQAVKKSIIQSPYIPTIHDIRKNALALIQPNNNNALDDWNECYQMICNGTYMTQEEFDKHSPICKKFLGSLTQLKAYATNEDFNLDVVRSNFLKQYEILDKRKQENELLPPKMQDFVNQISQNVDIKQLEKGEVN